MMKTHRFTPLLRLSGLFLAVTSLILGESPKYDSSANGANIDWDTKPHEGALPAGVQWKTFRSAAAGQDVSYYIYLPPQYRADDENRYPVIYNLHGNGKTSFQGFQDMELLHEGIQDGRWPPMIIVRPNGGRTTFYKDSYDGKIPLETVVIKELIPHIDRSYRTIAKREGRCIEGYSMGGRGATRLAMKYPQLFCSLNCQAGNVPRTSEGFDPSKPGDYPNNYLGPEKQNFIDNDAFKLLEKNVDQIRGKMRINVFCGTKDPGHLMTIRDFHQALLDLDVDHTYLEIEDMDHNRVATMELYRDIWFDYHVESLRRTGALSR
jgi:enterochelin esterase-like enzyme